MRWHEVSNLSSSSSSQGSKAGATHEGGEPSTSGSLAKSAVKETTTNDPLAEFYDQAKAELDDMVWSKFMCPAQCSDWCWVLRMTQERNQTKTPKNKPPTSPRTSLPRAFPKGCVCPLLRLSMVDRRHLILMRDGLVMGKLYNQPAAPIKMSSTRFSCRHPPYFPCFYFFIFSSKNFGSCINRNHQTMTIGGPSAMENVNRFFTYRIHS
jgi:hypothetical protein